MTSTTMKPIMMNTSSDMAEDPFADLPAFATDDATFTSPPPQLVSPMEFGTGIKYLQEQQQHVQQQEESTNENSVTTEKGNAVDTTETTVADDIDDVIEETPITTTTTTK